MNKNHLLVMFSVFMSLGLIVMAIWFSGGVNVPKAMATAGEIPFGGRITKVKYCCNGIRLTIYDVSSVSNGKSIKLMFIWGKSKLYEFYQIAKVGAWTLGNRTSFGECITIESECEDADNVDGEITIVGTSR